MKNLPNEPDTPLTVDEMIAKQNMAKFISMVIDRFKTTDIYKRITDLEEVHLIADIFNREVTLFATELLDNVQGEYLEVWTKVQRGEEKTDYLLDLLVTNGVDRINKEYQKPCQCGKGRITDPGQFLCEHCLSLSKEDPND